MDAALTYAVPMTRGLQIRAARALLGWTQEYLAHQAGVAALTVNNFEAGRTSPNIRTVEKLEAALKQAGVVCFDEDERGGMGVRFK